MVATRNKSVNLLVIVGPTASGKSALALKIAKAFNGEIIAADSRTIYKGMDIGTAKPTRTEQNIVPHWGIDLVEPGISFSAARFKEYAEAKIADIRQRDKLPILVGGTGLYIDSVVFDFKFPPVSDSRLRRELENMTVDELQGVIRDKNYKMSGNLLNRRHLIRTIEREGSIGSRATSPPNSILMIGLLPCDQKLRENIDHRAEEMFQGGIVNETEKLLSKYGRGALESTGGIIYRVCLRLISGEVDKAQAIDLFKKSDWQYARRQKTWFKRNKFIQWYADSQEAFTSVYELLDN
jgi:tRNA dimethylallyltransferase